MTKLYDSAVFCLRKGLFLKASAKLARFCMLINYPQILSTKLINE